jgi:hypothetical protein
VNDTSGAPDNLYLTWSKTELIDDGNAMSSKMDEDKLHPIITGNEECSPNIAVEVIAPTDNDILDYQVVQDNKDGVVTDNYIPVAMVTPKQEDIPLEQAYEYLYAKWMDVMYVVQDSRPGPGLKPADWSNLI